MRRNKDRLADGSYVVGDILIEPSTDYPGRILLIDLKTKQVLMIPENKAFRLAVALRGVVHTQEAPKDPPQS